MAYTLAMAVTEADVLKEADVLAWTATEADVLMEADVLAWMAIEADMLMEVMLAITETTIMAITATAMVQAPLMPMLTKEHQQATEHMESEQQMAIVMTEI